MYTDFFDDDPMGVPGPVGFSCCNWNLCVTKLIVERFFGGRDGD